VTDQRHAHLSHTAPRCSTQNLGKKGRFTYRKSFGCTVHTCM
jgi:hypothetical protein